MPVELCHHVKEDGISCHSPALRGLGYCHFHLRYKGHRLRTWRNQQRIGGWRFPQSMATNLNAIEASLKRVEMALSAGTVDAKRARLIRYGLRMAASNLRYAEAHGGLQNTNRFGQPTRGLPEEKAAANRKTVAKNTTRQVPPARPEDRTGAKVIPFDSIFCDKSLRPNYLYGNSRQATDSKDTVGRGGKRPPTPKGGDS